MSDQARDMLRRIGNASERVDKTRRVADEAYNELAAAVADGRRLGLSYGQLGKACGLSKWGIVAILKREGVKA